jgi:hypothetical protein
MPNALSMAKATSEVQAVDAEIVDRVTFRHDLPARYVARPGNDPSDASESRRHLPACNGGWH